MAKISIKNFPYTFPSKNKKLGKTYCALIIMPPGKTEIDNDMLKWVKRFD